MEFLEALSISDEHIGLYLHEIAFQPVVQAQGSDEQHEVWLAKSQEHAILGWCVSACAPSLYC
jgi:acyl-CoA oxidase